MREKLTSAARPRRLVLQLTAMAAASFILPKASGAQQSAEEPAKSPALSDGISIFEDVWQTVRDRFYDPHFNGLDWSAVGERYRAAAAAGDLR